MSDQWVKIKEKPSGASAYVQVDLDPDFTNSIQEAWLYWEVYIPSDLLNLLGNNDSTTYFLQSDDFGLNIIRRSGPVYHWDAFFGAGTTEFGSLIGDTWYTVEVHLDANAPAAEVRIDSGSPVSLTAGGSPAGINFLSANEPYFQPPANTPPGYIGVDNMAYSLEGWVSDGFPRAQLWDFEGADPLNDANTNWPDPPFSAGFGPDGLRTTVETGAPGPGPGPPAEDVATIHTFIDDINVSGCVLSGSITRRLNRPWQATVRMPSECSIGDACSYLRIVVDGWADPAFHGLITQISTEGDEEGCYTEYTALDPMFLWQFRPARSGPESADPGDFSNPDLFNDPSNEGPEILHQVLKQSENDANPQFGEGPLFISYADGDFAGGGVDLSGAPTDWPMTIAEVFELLASTGELDAILTPINTDGNGNICALQVFNGNYGNDLTGTVSFDYATGQYNVKNVRMTEDSTNVVNKLWYYGGPRVGTSLDPAGDQHWCYNIQGFDTGLNYPPGGQSVFIDNTPWGPPWTDNPIGERIYNSRIACGVRMEVQIFDAQGENCGDAGASRELQRRLWQMESYLRAVPRTLVHVTPVRLSDNMQLPPGVTPVQLGDFDIGDLVTVTAGSIVRGGFSGAQRIYEYTVSWDEDGVVELGELLTTSDQEGVITGD